MLSKLPTITLVHDTERERQAQTTLLTLFDTYCLDKWFYTETIQIEEGAISHSHPVLTLGIHPTHTRIPERLLSVYLHEQMHWFLCLEALDKPMDHAIAEFRGMFTDIPVGGTQGCRSAFSNYLHILVNTLEYQSITELFGKETARSQLEKVPFYTSVYKIVLEHETEIAEVMQKHNVILPKRPPEAKRFVEVG
jgi:hypothetical protein